MNTGEIRRGVQGWAAASLFLGLSFSFGLSACGRALSLPAGAREAVGRVAFSCGAGEKDTIESWGRAGASRGCYLDGRKNGRFIFWEAGYMNLEGHYSDDAKDGTWTVFNGDGSIFAEIVFEHGVKLSKTYR